MKLSSLWITALVVAFGGNAFAEMPPGECEPAYQPFCVHRPAVGEPVPGETSVALGWLGRDTYPDRLHIFRNGELIATRGDSQLSAHSYTDSGPPLQPDTVYVYRVCNEYYGAGSFCTQVSTRTKPRSVPPPAAPANLRVDSAMTKHDIVVLRWQNPAGSSAQRLSLTRSPGGVLSGSFWSDEYGDRDVQPLTTYTYTLCAVNSASAQSCSSLTYRTPVQPLPEGPTPQGDTMRADEVLRNDQSIRSADGRYTLVFQADGNFVLYRTADWLYLWDSQTNKTPSRLLMQSDGNLVIYAATGAVWSSGTAGNSGSRLVVQNDGNVVIYRPDGRAVWATNTAQLPVAQGDTMLPNQMLHANEWLRSQNGQYTFYCQADGNLVLYRTRDWAYMWDSGTHAPGAVCVLQGDGNLLINIHRSAIWASNTGGNWSSRLVVQDDGNVVIYRPDGRAVWATDTVQSPLGDLMRPYQTLTTDSYLRSPNGKYTLYFQADGNLVLHKTRGWIPIWASNTNAPGARLMMQGDGNLVIYRPDGRVAWASNTGGNTDSVLLVQNDGNVVLYRPDGRAIWASNTAGR